MPWSSLCDHGSLSRADKARQENFSLELDSCLQSGDLCGELCDFVADLDQLCRQFQGHPAAYLDSFLASAFPQQLPPQALLSITCKQLPSYGGSLDTAVSDLTHYQKNQYAALVLCGSRRRGEILLELMQERGLTATLAVPATALPRPEEILLTDGSLPAGLEYPTLRLAILTEGQITAAPVRKKPARKKATNRQKLNAFTDLSPGDLVVHETHGIGRYVAMEQMKVGGVVKDYVKIAYQGTDVLFVPATQLDLVSKYIGGGEDAPVRLSKLGGDGWKKTKAKAKAAAKNLAAGLIQLYAARKRRPGYAFAADSPWQQEFEEGFPYAETEDQLRCVAEIKKDMESPTPMDRLLCGDVGFGKTEVALRAAMKAMLDGKQVAILVPTTVLAQQHYLTALKRFAGFPVNIDVLSRFRTAAQQKKTLHGLATGTVDLIVGTHKLLQKSVEFKDLGLLIVDEEQRFGVSHKERLKELSQGVDVLTLSATPIPRTLNMALSGIRDMSTIEEPPLDRYPVQTFVLEHDDRLLYEAMGRELARGGQVYYLHNRVESIDQAAARIQARFPEAEVAVAHGKMDEEQLGDVMERMAGGEIQILVCTTIIETGIDIPNVNTLIIEDADRLGLAQLHQIRGRVGRSSRHAYAYLTFRKGKVLSEVAEKRLSAIREFGRVRLRLQDRHARPGNPRRRRPAGRRAVGPYALGGLRYVFKAPGRGRAGGAGRGSGPAAGVYRGPGGLGPTSPRRTSPRGSSAWTSTAAWRPSAPRKTARSSWTRSGPLRRPAAGGDEPGGHRAAPGQGLGSRHLKIEQKGDQLQITKEQLDFPAVSAVCAEKAYQRRIFFSAGDKPMLTLKLQKNEDPLRAAQGADRPLRGGHIPPAAQT